MDDDKRRAVGMRTRRAVLGDAHVDRAVERTTDLTADFQDFITRVAWGDIWTRPGLDQQTRRLLTLAMLIALNRQEEFEMHARAALSHGVNAAVLKELVLHSAIYCGVPAANNAFASLAALLTEPSEPMS